MRTLRLFLWRWCALTLEIEDDEGAGAEITGGSSHNFERDMNPLSADGEEPWDEFGFH